MNTARVCVAAITLLACLACSKSDAANTNASNNPGAEETHTAVNPIPVASEPANPCGWISQKEVEAVIGQLAEPPAPYEGACRYTLPIPPAVMSKRQDYIRMMTAISKIPGAEPMKKKEWDPYAIDVSVNVNGDVGGERVAGSTFKILKGWAGDSTPDTVDTRRNRNGWDVQKVHGGRIGHIDVDVSLVSLEVELPRDRLDTLAVRIRNHLTDLPYPMPSDYSTRASRDPCVLLTRQEAEAVLGPLVVSPYRSGKDGPLAYPNGTSCSYFTRGHHLLVLTPRWSDGKSALAATRGVEGIMGRVVGNSSDQSADTLEGPWDQAAIDIDGRLALLKGDRLLEIQYLMSSTDEAGALKLARSALERLASSK